MTERVTRLIDALVIQTRAGRLTWHHGVEDSYSANVGSGVVRVNLGGPEDPLTVPDGKPRVWLTISDAKARIVDEVSATPQEADSYTRLQALVKAARWSATGGDEVIDEMIQTLTVGS